MSLASLFTILNNVTTKTYVTGITIYNTLTRFIESCQSIVYSDASDIGFGGCIVEYCI
jgi:hypothetical protein